MANETVEKKEINEQKRKKVRECANALMDAMNDLESEGEIIFRYINIVRDDTFDGKTSVGHLDFEVESNPSYMWRNFQNKMI